MECSCPVPHFANQCCDIVAAGDLVQLGSSSLHVPRPYALGQFDGGCHASISVGGAGYGIYLVYPECVQLYCWRAIGLANCEDNVVAEAKACRFLVDDVVALACGELQHLDLLRVHTVIQGDILPVIKYLSFSSRLRRADLLEDLEHIHRTASRFFTAARWRALPREANELADLAGRAAKHMLDRALSSFPCQDDVCLRPELPVAKLVSRGGEPCAMPIANFSPSFTLHESPTIQSPLVERIGTRYPIQVSIAKAQRLGLAWTLSADLAVSKGCAQKELESTDRSGTFRCLVQNLVEDLTVRSTYFVYPRPAHSDHLGSSQL